jgi:hypothetical protein
MDLGKLIRELHAEKERLGRVIVALEDFESARNDALGAAGNKRRGRTSMGTAERSAVSRRMKAYWSRRRKERSAR